MTVAQAAPIAQIETIPTAKTLEEESPRLSYLHHQAELAEAAAQAELLAIQSAQATLERVSVTHAARAQAVQHAEDEAQAAATRTLREGTADARGAERKADAHAQRLRRELARAEAAVQGFQADLTVAQNAYGPAAQAAVAATYA